MAGRRLDKALTDSFLALVRSGLHGSPVTTGELDGLRALTSGQWEEMLGLARVQTVSGLLQSAVEMLPEGIEIPSHVEMELLAESVRIERQSALVSSSASEVLNRLRAAGLHPVLFKGPSVAAYYPVPDRRSPGDIDIYLQPEEFGAGADILGSGVQAPDGSMHSDAGEVDIDLHSRYYDLSVPAGKLPVPGSPEGVLLMLSAHIFKHVCGVGVGLRQCCDYARARCVLGPDATAMEPFVNAAGLRRWSRLLDTFADTYLSIPGRSGTDSGVRSASLAGSAPAVNPEPLLRLVLDSGNFGTAVGSRTAALGRSAFRRKTDTFLRMVGRLPFSLRYAPGPAFSNVVLLLRGNL